METDAVLLERYARHRADEAFTELARRHVDLVYSAALRQVRDVHLAEDVTQAAFIVLSRKTGSLSLRTVLPAWLLRVTRCAALDALRRQACRRRKEREASPVREPTTSGTPQPEWQMLAPLLDEGLAALNETDRSAIVLRFFANLAQHEVGTRLGISEDAAEKRVARALEKLRRFFARRGVVLVVPLMASLLSHHAVQAAPEHVAGALPGAVAASAGGVQITTGSSIADGTLKDMAWAAALGKALVAAAVLAGVVGVLSVAHLATRSSPDEVAQRNAVVNGTGTQQAPAELRPRAEAPPAATASQSKPGPQPAPVPDQDALAPGGQAKADGDLLASLKQLLRFPAGTAVPATPQEPQVLPLPDGQAPQWAGQAEANGPQGRIVDLLALIDPEKDAVVSKWQKQNGNLVSSPTGVSRLEIPYQPPEEYDFRITFTRMGGNNTVVQYLFKADHHLMWQLGGWENTYVGFELINDYGVNSNPTGIKRFPVLTNGRVHTSEVRVRNTGLTAYFDGQLASQWKTNYSDMTCWTGFGARQENLLALGSISAWVMFHTVEVREVTGRGRSFRTLLPGQPPSIQSGDQFVQEVAALPAEEQARRVAEKLKELNPGYTGPAFFTFEGGKLTGLNVDSAAVADLSPLLALPELRSLRVCRDVGEVPKSALQDLVQLAGLKLTRLEIAGKLIKDLAPLAGMPLKTLTCSGTGVADLSPLKGLALVKFACDKTQVSDLSPLAGMPLETLSIRDTRVADLAPLKGLPLRVLDCTGTRVTDLSPLKECPLVQLKCDAVPVRDADALLALTQLKFFNGWPAYEARENWTLLRTKPQELGDVAAGRKPVNLLTLVDPQRDAVAGVWQRNPISGELVADNTANARLEIPYQPPAEYDLEIQFTRVAGFDTVTEVLVQNGRQFTWVMGGYANTVFGFEHLPGKGALLYQNPIRARSCLTNGKRYSSVVQVRKDSITVYFNGKLLTCWKTDGAAFALPDWTKLRNGNTLGLRCHGGPTIFHAADLYEVTGQGKTVDVAPAAPANPDTPVLPPRPPKREPAADF